MTLTSETSVDLTNCDREPIHIPGRIQPHGVLLALNEADLRILQASTNTLAYFGRATTDLLGQQLDVLFEPEILDYLRQIVATEDVEQNPRYLWTVRVRDAEQAFEGVLHRNQGVLILELEPVRPEPGHAIDHYHRVKSIVVRLEGEASFDTFCARVAKEVRGLIGFDRVMVYQFDADGHGTVIAEEATPGLPSYLGLHYPASDIPQQARALYLRNWLRLIPDIRYVPVDLVPTLTPGYDTPLDLSYAVLRSVSPIHIEYLGNMGVQASMSISLVKDGALWGLIACHHYSPRYLAYPMRSACEFLGQAVSLQLTAKERMVDQDYQLRIKEVSAELTEAMVQDDQWIDVLTTRTPGMLELLNADGAAVCYGSDIRLIGATPAEADVRALVEWLAGQHADVFETNSLALAWPELAHLKDTASGVLAAPIASAGSDYLLWFRPEVVQTVNWSGEPAKAVTMSDDGVRLSPRKSFELWQQTLALHALPWKSYEITAAEDFRNAMRGIVLRRANELALMNAELERSNAELDSFVYIASHDLKEPLRGLHNYAHFLLEDYHDRLEPDGQNKLNALIRLTQRMETLIDSLLLYSRVGQVAIALQETDFNDLLAEVLDSLDESLRRNDVEMRIPRSLPTLRCDRVQIGEVFQNLISNAIKYNTSDEKWIEIGFVAPSEQSEAMQQGAPAYVFYVRDNGIGITQKHFENIFRMYKRLHGRNQYGGGAGLGLTIAKKIVERYNGRIWLESVPGAGSTFFFTVKENL